MKSKSNPFHSAALRGAAVVFACFSMLNTGAKAADALWIGSAGDHNLTTGSNWFGGIPAGDWYRLVFGGDVVDGTLDLNNFNGRSGITLTSGVTQDITIVNNQPLIMGAVTSDGGIDMSSAAHNLTINTSYWMWGDADWNIASGRTLTIHGGIAQNAAHNITLHGGGTVVLSSPAGVGATSITGTTTINGGVLSAIRDTLGSGPIVINSGGELYVNDQWVLQGANPWVNSYGVVTSVTVNTGGQLVFDAVNGFANLIPNLYLNGGSVSGGVTADPWSAFNLYNGNEQITAGGATTSTISSAVGLTGNNNIVSVGSGSSLNISGVLKNGVFGAGGFIKADTGTLNLTGTNTYTGNTTISAGTLEVGGAGTLGGGSYAGAISNNGAFVHSSSVDQTLSGAISGAGSITQNGTGTLNLTGTNTYTGNTTISAGTLEVGGAGTLGGGSYAGAISNNGAFVHSSSVDQTLSGAISGAGSITQNGTGTLTLTGTLTYSGGTTVNDGTLIMPSGGWHLNGIANYPITVNAGGTLQLPADPSAYTAGLTLNGGTISSSGVNSSGWPNITLVPDSTLTAGGAAVSTISTWVGFSGNGTFSVGSGSTLNITGPLTGDWIADRTGFFKTDVGTLTLSSAGNSFDCDTTISGGTLAFGGAGQLNGGNYGYNIINNAALVYGSSAAQTLSGAISGTGTLTQNAGTLTLSGANTYSGATTVNAGTLTFGSVAAVGNTSGITVNGAYGYGGHLRFDSGTDGGIISTPISVVGGDYSWNMSVTVPNNLTFTGPINLSGAALIVSEGANSTLNFNNAFHGTEGLTFAALSGGKNLMVLSGASDFSGDLSLVNWSGSPQVTLSGGDNRLPTTAVVRLAGATGSPSALELNGNNQTIAGLGDAGWGGMDAGARHVVNTSPTAVTLTLNTTADQSSGATIGGTDINGTTGNNLALVKTGTAKQTLTGTNTYTGATTIHQGTLALGSSGSIANSTTLVVGDAGSSGAVLDVSLSGGFTVGSTQTLKGIGTVNVGTGNTLTINGTHAPGNSPGVQSVTGNLSYGTGSIFEWDLASSATGTRGTQYDGVNVTGNLGGSGAIFKVVLDSGSYAEDFWKSNQSWTGIFTANNTIDMAAIFSSIQWYQGASNSTTPDHITAPGYFSFTNSGATLTWTAVPEPTSALAGLLLGAGLLRRRRR